MYGAIFGGLQLAGGLLQGLSAVRQAKLQNQMAIGNAGLMDMRADDVERIGADQANKILDRTSYMTGQQKAAQAASGLNLNVGTPALIRQEDSRRGTLDAMTMRNNTWRQAFGLRNQAENMRMQGSLGLEGARASVLPNMISSAANSFPAFQKYWGGS